ncbi:MAG: YqaJ viral recombinase family protein [Patescibacteria group bacterium]|nr:YqaJ viral recombinase family protein [Patescibacteria group bacterium]
MIESISWDGLLAEPTPTPGSPEWHALRRTGIGGTDAASIMGLGYQTPYDLWELKTGRRAPEDLSGLEAVRLGARLEAVVADEYADRAGAPLLHVRETLRRADKPWMFAHVDRTALTASGPVGIEIKTAGLVGVAGAEWGEDGSDEVPAGYLVQVQWYMAVTQWQLFRIVALLGGRGIRVYEIPRDPEIIDALEQQAEQFWACVQADFQPPIVSVDDARKRWSRSRATAKIASAEILDHDAQLRGLDAHIKEIEAYAEEHRAAIMAFMGDADTLVDGAGRRLRTWKSSESTRLDSARVKAEYPEIAAACSVITSSRRFLECKP